MARKTFDRANPALKQIDVYSDFTGGLNTEYADMNMRDNQFRELVNFDFDFAGSLTKRPGLRKIAKLEAELKKAFKRVYPNAQDLLELEILDCVNFFDGLNWVFNYMTNKGLGVAILSKNLEVILDTSTGEVKDPTLNFVFYPNIKNNIKISAYSDYYVMMTTEYITIPASEDPTKKQVRLYSWNPIPNLKYTKPGTTTPITINKEWVEAGATKADDINETYYGNSLTETIKSTGSLPTNPSSNISISLNLYPNPLIQKYYNFCRKFKFSAKYNRETVNLDLMWTNPGTSTVKFKSIPIKAVGFISEDKQILQMTMSIDYGIYFRFYQPLTNRILNLYLPIPDDNIFNPDEYQISVIHKPAFKKIYNITQWDQRAKNFLESQDGVPIEVTYKDLIPTNGNLSIISSIGQGYNDKPTGHLNQKFNIMNPNASNLKPFNTSSIVQTGLSAYSGSGSTHTNYAQVTQDFVRQELALTNNRWKIYDEGFFQDTSSSGYKSMTFPAFKEDESVSKWVFKTTLNIRGQMKNPFWFQETTNLGGGFIVDVLRFLIPSLPDYSLIYKKNYFIQSNNIGQVTDVYTTNTGNYNSTAVIPTYKPKDSGTPVVSFGYSSGFVNKSGFFSTFNYQEYDTTNLKHNYFSGTNSTGFAFAQGQANISIGGQSVNIPNFYFAGLLDNDLTYIDPLNLNYISDILKLNNRESLLENISTTVLWSSLLGPTAINNMKKILTYLQQGKLVKINNRFSYIDASNQEQVLNSNLRQNELLDLIQLITNNPNYSFKVYDIRDTTNNLITFKITTLLNNKEVVVFDIADYQEIQVSDYNQVFKTFKCNFVYTYYPEGIINSVIQFKNLLYQKPNLNDLTYLWYNFALFNKYKNSTQPDIYNTTKYTSLSKDLIDYPVNEGVLNPVQLYGIIPVNNLILSPGENQKFQVFVQFSPTTKIEDILCVVSAMPLSDFTTRQQQKEFDTQTSLKWEKWADQFPGFTIESGKPAILTLSIPSTTSPYVVVIQAGKKITEGTDIGKVNLATVVETRIELAPQSNIIQKVDIPALFDEFTASSQMRMFETSSALVVYGKSNKIFFSDIAVPGYFPVSRVIQLKTPEAITSTIMFQNKLIVSTENTRWYIGGTSFDAEDVMERHSVKLISSNSGAISPKSSVPFGDRLYYIDSNGIKYLKNLYGTSDKEFTYEQADKMIKKIVPIYDEDAVSISYNQKLYINFPSELITLVYNRNYDSWVMYESPLMAFSNFFINEGELYAVGKYNFNVYQFDKLVVVDGWCEEDGYEIYEAPDGTKHKVQKGIPIVCRLETKELDQDYVPHRKKYINALINTTISGTNGTITPTISIDSEKINYKVGYVEDSSNTVHYVEQPTEGINLVNSTNLNWTPNLPTNTSLSNIVVGQSLLGETKAVYYNIPLARTGNTVSFKFIYDAPSIIVINSLSIRYSLRLPKKHRGGK